jgi:hypothetical protein
MLIPVPITDEQAKLGQEVVKTAQTLIALFGDAGRAFSRSQLATIFSDLIGHKLGADKLHDERQRNLLLMKARQEELQQDIDQARIGAPSPSVVLPLLEAAMDESREELQELWARLLANAMIDDGSKVRRDYFTTLKAMEPLDVAVLDMFDAPGVDSKPVNVQRLQILGILVERGIKGYNEDAILVSLDALKASRCLESWDVQHGVALAPYGRAFLAACRVE